MPKKNHTHGRKNADHFIEVQFMKTTFIREFFRICYSSIAKMPTTILREYRANIVHLYLLFVRENSILFARIITISKNVFERKMS
jgi:hypothetical protein